MVQNKALRYFKCMSPRTNRKQKELTSLGFLNVEKRVKQLRLNHPHNIVKNVCPSCLKIKGIESETFYYHVNQDGYFTTRCYPWLVIINI